MHMDPAVPTIVGICAAVLGLGLLARRLGQPHVVAYLLAGVALGAHGLGLLTDTSVIARTGEFGVILLLFFVGMEVSLPSLLKNWRVAVLGTVAQIGLSVGVTFGIGHFFDWPVARCVLLGFVISLSSTAVVVSLLRQHDEMDSPTGRDALGILIVQDLALVPMLVVIGLLGSGPPALGTVTMQIVGGAAIAAATVWLIRRPPHSLPLWRWVEKDHELQVFLALILCFGMAYISGALHLSAALGAFVAGLVVAALRDTKWVHHSLEPMRVVLVALFFVSVGMLVDLGVVVENWLAILLMVAGALVTNTAINAVILRIAGRSWRRSLRVGALLGQIGELSFVLAALGGSTGVLTELGVQLATATIALTLLLSPPWIAIVTRISSLGTKDDDGPSPAVTTG